MTGGQLPVRLGPVAGESLSSFVQRLAVANDVASPFIVGAKRDFAARSRFRDSVLSRVAVLSGLPVDFVRRLTLEGSYPDWVCTQTVVGLGRVGRPVYCPACSPSSGVRRVDWELAIQVACGDCGVFLRRLPSADLRTACRRSVQAPAGLLEVQEQAMVLLQQSVTDVVARRQLTALASGVVRYGYSKDYVLPVRPLSVDEASAVSAALDLDHDPAQGSDVIAAAVHAPAVVARRLLELWEPTCAVDWLTLARTGYPSALPGRVGEGPFGRMVRSPDVLADPVRRWVLDQFGELSVLGLRPHHVPALIRLDDDPLVMSGVLAEQRADLACVMVQLLLADESGRSWGDRRAVLQMLGISRDSVRAWYVATVGAGPADPAEAKQLVEAGRGLIDGGLIDHAARREQLGLLTAVEPTVIRELTEKVRRMKGAEAVAADWVRSYLSPAGSQVGWGRDWGSRGRLQEFTRLLTADDEAALAAFGVTWLAEVSAPPVARSTRRRSGRASRPSGRAPS